MLLSSPTPAWFLTRVAKMDSMASEVQGTLRRLSLSIKQKTQHRECIRGRRRSKDLTRFIRAPRGNYSTCLRRCRRTIHTSVQGHLFYNSTQHRQPYTSANTQTVSSLLWFGSPEPREHRRSGFNKIRLESIYSRTLRHWRTHPMCWEAKDLRQTPQRILSCFGRIVSSSRLDSSMI